MEKHRRLSDNDFLRKFKETSLDPSVFTHEAHLRLAYLHLSSSDLYVAISSVCEQIKKFDAVHGDGTKYHHTLTVAAVYAVNHFIHITHAKDFEGLIVHSPQLKSRFKDLILTHYSPSIFNNIHAREHFVPPDLAPFTSPV